ncbi:MAG TPA: tetratricopeptide repeat protein, partial [Desulfuromonadaceae bacterium]
MLIRLFIAVVIISTLQVPVGFCQETEDSQIFIAGFNAYQQKDYPAAIAKLKEVLAKYPDTSLRDMALFWLARSYYKNGNQLDAARVMSQFSKEYPDNPLKATVEEDLLNLVARYEKGEKLPTGTPPVKVAQEQAAPKVQAGQERPAAGEEQRRAAEKAKVEQAQLAAKKAEQERLAREKAAQVEQERLAARKADEERRAAEAARRKQEQERIAAAEKAAAEAEAARLAAARKEQERLVAAQAEKERQARQRVAEEKAHAAKTALREKAIAQYKSIIEKYPDSPAALAAVAKLKELGVAVAMPKQTMEQKPEEQAENAQVLKLQVAQFAGFEFNLLAKPQAYDVARRISIPFEIINRGNGKDSFNLESGFPADFKAGFAPASSPNQPISQTPVMAPGESFKGIVTLTIPATSIDGLRITHPVKAASRFMGEASQSREITLIAAAPLLRAVLRTDATQPLPGEKIRYHVAVLNVGSTAARNVTFRLDYPPQFEPLDYAPAGFKREHSALVLDGMEVKSGESREFTITFQLKDDSLAGQELLCRAELVNNPLKTSAAFISNVAFVKPQRGITVRTDAGRLMAIPGQTVTIPLVVT